MRTDILSAVVTSCRSAIWSASCCEPSHLPSSPVLGLPRRITSCAHRPPTQSKTWEQSNIDTMCQVTPSSSSQSWYRWGVPRRAAPRLTSPQLDLLMFSRIIWTALSTSVLAENMHASHRLQADFVATPSWPAPFQSIVFPFNVWSRVRTEHLAFTLTTLSIMGDDYVCDACCDGEAAQNDSDDDTSACAHHS
jgi:hypothetical protein